MKLVKPFDDTFCALIIEIVRNWLDQFPQSFRKYHKKFMRWRWSSVLSCVLSVVNVYMHRNKNASVCQIIAHISIWLYGYFPTSMHLLDKRFANRVSDGSGGAVRVYDRNWLTVWIQTIDWVYWTIRKIILQ